jgi:hypothetical protein
MKADDPFHVRIQLHGVAEFASALYHYYELECPVPAEQMKRDD